MQRSWAEDDDSAPPLAPGHVPCEQIAGTERVIFAVRRRVYFHCVEPVGPRHAGHRQSWRRCELLQLRALLSSGRFRATSS